MIPESSAPQPEQVAAFFTKHRTGLVTLVFTDLVDSSGLLRTLGDQAGATFMQRRRQLMREVLGLFPEGEEIGTAGDSFLLAFTKPSDAVRYALQVQARLRGFSRESGLSVQERIGIHLGEVVIAEHETQTKAKDLYGLQLTTCARVMSLAQGGQTLLTRGVFDSARQVLKGEDLPGVGPLSWMSHGPYQLKGIEELVEVDEVGETGQSPLSAPTTSEKARRVESAEGETVLGWRPAVGQEVPNTKWVLKEKLGEGGFGEVWKARHEKLKEFRVFKFCFRADRVRSLKREVTLFRLLKERVGKHPNIVKLHDIYFDQPPYYLEEEYVEGKDLRHWCESQGGVEKVPLEVRLEIVAQAADALQAAHDAGVIHRDVKPGNVLVSGQWSVVSGQKEEAESALAARSSSLTAKLTDFGIGQVISEEVLKDVTRAGFTQTMMSPSSSYTGTHVYMAPELLVGQPASTRSDIYSLGVVLYQLLMGDFKRPVAGDWSEDIQDPLLHEDLRHCLAGKPADRFAAAALLAKNLRALPERRAQLARQAAEKAEVERAAYRRGMIRTASIAALVLCSVVVLALIALGQASRARRLAVEETHQRQLAEQTAMDLRRYTYAVNVRLAQASLEEGNLGRARELLENCRPRAGEMDLREWAWRYLWNQSRGDEALTLTGHVETVEAIRFSADGRSLISGDSSGMIQVRKVPSFEVTQETRHPGRIGVIDITCDGRFVASSGDGTVQVWDTEQEQIADSFFASVSERWEWVKGGGGYLLFNAAGDRLLVGDNTGQIHLRDWRARTNIFSQKIQQRGISAMAYSTEKCLLATAGASPGEVHLWKAEGDARLIQCSQLETNLARIKFLFALAFSPSGEWLVGACSSFDGGFLRIWDVASGRTVTDLEADTYWVGGIGFSHDGRRLYSGGRDQPMKIWEVGNWKKIAELQGHLDGVWCLDVAPGGDQVVTGGKDTLIKIWDGSASGRSKDPAQIATNVNFVASADRKAFLTRRANGPWEGWDANTLQPVEFPPLLNYRVHALNTDAGLALVSDKQPGRQLLDLRNRALRKIPGEDLWFAGDFKSLLIRESPMTLAAYRLPQFSLLVKLRETHEIWPLAFSSSGRYAAVWRGPRKSPTLRRACFVWDLSTGRRHEFNLSRSDITPWACFSPDERLLAVGGTQGLCELLDIGDSGITKIQTLMPHLDALGAGTFTSDGRILAMSTTSRKIWLFDTLARQGIAMLQPMAGIPGWDWTLFSEDGSNLIVQSERSIYVFHAPSLESIDRYNEDTRNVR